MVEPGSEVMEIPALVVTVIVGATILVIVYISSLFKSQKEDVKKSKNHKFTKVIGEISVFLKFMFMYFTKV